MIQNVSGCSELVPAELVAQTPSAGVPVLSSPIGEWIAFGDAQTAQLDKANSKAPAVMKIVTKCEARDKAAYVKITKKWWQVWR